METEAIKIDVFAKATPKRSLSSLGFLTSNVLISQIREFEEFIVDESDGGSISSLGSHPDSSFNAPLTLLKFDNFTPSHVYTHCHGKFHDHALSWLLTDRIVAESQRRDLPQGPLFMKVCVKFTQKEYFVVPWKVSAPSTRTTDSDQEAEHESCAICLENLSESESSKPICELPQCPHKFHEECYIEWLDRHNSCPLCRQPIY